MCRAPTRTAHRHLYLQLSLSLFLLVAGHENYDDETWDYFWGPEDRKGLFPNVFNLAANNNAVITANATCGDTGAETYCKLVEHVLSREPQCRVCDALSPENQHPIGNAIDGTDRYWQSPSLQNGKKYQWVTITLDLKQVYQVAYVILKVAQSPRPGNWILEHSVDGVNYKPWQYFAIHDAECWSNYNVRPTVGLPRYRSDDEVICTSYYSKLNPLEDGEIHTSLVNGRPGVDGPTEALNEFTKARYIRLRLQKIRTLNADLMTLQSDVPDNIDRTVMRRYYYTIKDISIGGQCVCSGHAKECPFDVKLSKLHCKCEHNTCGDSCEKCCPLHNQKPWRQGTNHDGALCEKCQCFGHADECVYDQTVAEQHSSLNIEGKYEGGGICVHCRNHTTGVNCEQCENGFFRPSQVAKDHPDPCRPCQCSGRGITGQCIKDDSHRSEGLFPGDCLCKLGFAGRRCERCAPGYRNYPICEACPCHHAGIVDPTVCEGKCFCKKNVEGIRCDHCKEGFYNLAANNPEGCSPCFCFGVTGSCESSDWGVEVVQNMPEWKVTDLKGSRNVYPMFEDGRAIFANDDLPGVDHYYWQAPPDYLGKKLYSYGGDLRFQVSYVVARGDTSGHYTESSDVIMEGNDQLIGYNWGRQLDEDNTTIAVPLREQNWFLLTAAGKPGRPLNRETFTLVLNRLKRLLIRAKFHTDQIEATLYNVEMETAIKESNSLKKMTGVERCHCPTGYSGLSCELCSPGYRRVNNTLVRGTCERCDCNSHAESCEVLTGKCQNCLHHTTGLKCDRCEQGYYGNPLLGTPFDCKRCACPLPGPNNNFSPTCNAVTTPEGKADYICTQCPEGHSGDKCERCADGFFGNPLVHGGFCQRCECSGNVDLSSIGYCDSVTGQCLKCLGNTGGWNCEDCLPGHFGNPAKKDCRACECNSFGSVNKDCNRTTGKCLCKPNYVGRSCDHCADGYGNIENSCPACRCDPVGAESQNCDTVSGQCRCKPGVFGTRCDQCLDGYYGFSRTGCKWCGCDSNGALNPQCNELTGQCQCRSYTSGRACDKCQDGFWNLISGKGCERCDCNITGSTSQMCNQLYGQCTCKPGVGGKLCDGCLPGHFGFSLGGCRKCDPCDIPGRICDPKSGRCICPPFTAGVNCQQCASAAWGFDPQQGCKPCECNRQGSASHDCDSLTGNCVCLEGFEGRRCDKCRFGFHRFPNCRRCKCKSDGTLAAQCTPEGRCQCDEDGQCPCKSNAEGKKCDRCREGSFGLNVENPNGCYDCFCFSRTRSCEQAKMVWDQAWMPTRTVHMTVGDTELTSLHGLKVIPGQDKDVSLGIPYVLDQPLYWALPQQFLGDKVTAYNGILEFRLESPSNVGGSRFPDALLEAFPLVLLQGNHRLILVHTHYKPVSGGFYTVRLHESEWKQHANPHVPVSRATMMVALQNLQHILIRATEGPDMKIVRISNTTLEVGVAISAIPVSSHVAMGVEMCRCPPQYSGSSCQDPNEGYYRRRKPNFLDSKDILDLVGWAEPCPCNNRSRTCDRETGICYNCTGNTAGPYCNECAKNYFGDPTRGPCRLCACPTATQSFSSSCRSQGLDYVCDNCQTGYRGRHCESCADGYYGNPTARGGSCKPCSCSAYGSRSQTCNKVTGQCDCLEGITGRDCTHCLPRYLLTEYGCRSCNDECTGLLLDEVDFLSEMVDRTNLTGISPAPWGYIFSINNETVIYRHRLEEYLHIIRRGKQLMLNVSSSFDLESKAEFLMLKARDVFLNGAKAADQAEETLEEAGDLLKLLDRLWDDILATVDRLRKHGQGPGSLGHLTEKAMQEAERILKELRGRNFQLQGEEAERELRKARALLDRVKKMTLDPLHIDGLEERLRKLNDLLRDFVQTIQESVRKPTQQAQRLVQDAKALYGEIKYSLDAINGHQAIINSTLNEAEELLDKARSAVIDAALKFEHLPILKKELESAMQQTENHRGILDRLNPEYLIKYVLPAQKHADDLEKHAKYLADLFKATEKKSDLPLRAAKVYQDIVDALKAAEIAARNAYAAAERAYLTAYPGTADALTAQAKAAKEKSLQLFNEAKKLMLDRVPELKGELNRRKKILDRVDQDISDGNRNIDLINKALDSLPSGVDEALKDTSEKHQGTMNSLGKTHKKIDDIRERINRELRPRAEHLKAGSAEGLDNLTRTIEKARDDIRESSKRATNAEKISGRVRSLHHAMQPNLKELRDKILLARQKASSIRISLSADDQDKCVRSYKPDIEPTTFNNLVLNYAIRSEASDALLLLLASKKEPLASGEPDDFMAVEMVDRKVRFLWNAGGGTKVIEHNRTIETNDQQLLKDDQWFKIEITRVGNVATLSVKRTPEGQKSDPEEVSGASPSGHSLMDLDPSSHFYVGGLPPNFKPPRELKSKNYAGCLYDLILDGKRVGLWNFKTSQGCRACREGATEEVNLSMYQFKGDGYAILPQIQRYNPKSTYVVSFQFKTLDENALLFLAPNLKKGDFVSVELRKGYVFFNFRIGNRPMRTLSTREKYNKGEWVKVAAGCENLLSLLSVANEIFEGEATSTGSGGSSNLDLTDSKLYYGGVPPNFTQESWNFLTLSSFLGCLRDLQIETTPLELLQGSYFGVEGGCDQKAVKVAAFKGDGYLEMRGQPLNQEASFSFSFHTTQADSLLLLSTFEGKTEDSDVDLKKHYYSVSLVNGKLELRFSSNAGPTLNVTKEDVNDGRYHSLTVTKTHRRIEIRLDDRVVSGCRLPKGSKDISAPKNGGLYFGGVNSNINIGRMAASRRAFSGTIKDAVFNNQLLRFNEPVFFQGVGIGRSTQEHRQSNDLPTVMSAPTERTWQITEQAQVPQRCVQAGPFTAEQRAAKFGDAIHSHVRVPIQKKRFAKDFNISFEFRTFYPNGLLAYLRNGKKPFFLGVMLQGGKINVTAFDKVNRQLVSRKGMLNDGAWHKAMLWKNRGLLTLSVDDLREETSKIRPRLGVSSPMYVGGLPQEMMGGNGKVITESFKGCIRNFHMDKKYIDLASGNLNKVFQCFRKVEPGAYFGKDAYAIYDRKFNIGDRQDLQVEFKTSEVNGILLSISEPSGSPSLALEIHNGQVVVTVETGSAVGRLTAIQNMSRFDLCDGRWHKVSMQYTRNSVSLKVDKRDVAYGLSDSFKSGPRTSSALFVGGLPEWAPKGSLHVKDNFKGCLRNLSINDKRLDWLDLAELHNVLPNSCPLF